jgi:glycosyltransferase involved in cell wall biosynthesis
MKIAQIAPLHESVPPKLYGGTERIVSYLTEELVAANHDVTLFASADSVTRARLVPALRLSATPIVDSVAHYIRLLELVFREADQFDILHFHIDYIHFPWTRRQVVPAVTTLHGKLDIPDLVELIGEIGEDEKEEFLGNALALLFPIDWPEPFGLVTIEAMACGTPVIAYRQGAVPEIIEEGKTGFIVDNQEDAVAAVDRLPSIDRVSCRREFERRFTANRMTADYIRIYEDLWSGSGRGKKVTPFSKAA